MMSHSHTQLALILGIAIFHFLTCIYACKKMDTLLLKIILHGPTKNSIQVKKLMHIVDYHRTLKLSLSDLLFLAHSNHFQK